MLTTKRCFHISSARLAFDLRTILQKKKHETTKDSCNDNHNHDHSYHKHSPLLVQPDYPVRTRFAPSPTGFLHLGSLRTALYNYLLAKSTGGQFLLRLEDTDQNRLVEGAEENIYDTLKWLNVEIDEGPTHPGPYAPYRQSERSEIYKKYSDELLNKGLAYRCFCSKERLDGLRDSARLLKPPTTVSYDRHCLENISNDESEKRAKNGESFTVRFKSPDTYPEFNDLLHGTINLQPQVNLTDRRYEDPVLMKSDNLPTYHFANVIDDHLMKITHVIRGEEWVASTPKHIALYNAFGWDKPNFIHIPLLTTVEGKKLSKRSGDIDIMSLKKKGYLNEALVNFSVLFGWNPKRELGEKTSEIYKLNELTKTWTLAGLTKGNAKVDWKKLDYFNKHYLTEKLKDQSTDFFKNAVIESHKNISETLNLNNLNIEKVEKVLKMVYPSLTKLNDFNSESFYYFFTEPKYDKEEALSNLKVDESTLQTIMEELNRKSSELTHSNFNDTIKHILVDIPELKKKTVFQTLRYALSGPQSGINLPIILELLGPKVVELRIAKFTEFIR
jgi:glutamyl-tRNA synthetase